MNFTVTKTFRASKDLPPIVTGLILIALPFIILIILGGLIWLLLLQVKRLFFKKSSLDHLSISQLKETVYLINRQNIKIELIEDNNDDEYNKIVDLWCDQVYDEDVFIYRATTEPVVQGLTNEFITSFIKETDTGAFVQILNKDKTQQEQVIDTTLSFLNYADLTVKNIENIGPYFLYIDKQKPDLISGFNRDGNIELSVTKKNGM
jgi:hypothetical protein